MDAFDLDGVNARMVENVDESPLKAWRLLHQEGTINTQNFINFIKLKSRLYFDFQYETETDPTRPSLKCTFREDGAKEGIIDELLAFMLGDNPNSVLDKLELEGNTATVCGRVFKNGEPTYSCRECGMDPTCVLCVNCFKQSAHRYHKYKMSMSGGGGCCDCGDVEAWKKDHYCEEHLRAMENPAESKILNDAIMKRCELAFDAILTFCVKYIEIETNASLECLDGDDLDDSSFCTILYNDESHTFDQVIQTLTKIVKCRQKDATEIVSSIDREGRAVVKCASFADCDQLKHAIESQGVPGGVSLVSSRVNQSLRVSVLHISKVACQQFALQLLTWFQAFLTRHRMFRQLFARMILTKKSCTVQSVPYHIGHILEYDVKLWKMARTCWHRLLISGLLMEYDNKMALAQSFSRHYASIMQDFIRDDHDHTFSIVSLSVQLFTVPSIAHYLIANEGIFFKLLHTFYNESVEKYIQNKTLHFAKNNSSLGYFKRSAYILYDLRYILSFKPDVWTNGLRDGFLEGCKIMLRLLNVMQGMESITRQTGQHMDYEPEWECAFNLHIKLATTISLLLDWCRTDKAVLVSLYQTTMRYLMTNNFILSNATVEEKTVRGHTANCIMYDVASQPVSIHLPLSRLFAGIYLHLGAYDLNYHNVTTMQKRTPVELLEPVLCTQTMIAQVCSNMWRRNGYSLLHQLYFYRNVRCRGEMLDRDIVCMQIGASLIENNEYLIHILNKFALLNWVQPEYKDTQLKTEDEFLHLQSMIDEFLELLVVIIGERYVPGISNITDEDRTRKEIVQLLCMKTFSHSELNRAMPDTNDTSLDDVIDSVAVFKKPLLTSDSKGVYELRDEMYDDFNMYFYHYTKEEKSKSEEIQCLRRKNKGELACCPPPKLPKLTESFVGIVHLLECDVMMAILTTVLDRAIDPKAISSSENHLQKVLFLICYGLQEEESGNYPTLKFCAAAQKCDILSKLDKLSHHARGEAHRDFILWTIRKFKEVHAMTATADSTMQGNEADKVEGCSEEDSESPSLNNAEQEKQEKEERSRLAAERRAKIMAQMQSAQNSFMKSNAEMFATTNAAGRSGEAAAAGMEWQDEKPDEEEEGAVAYTSMACLGVDRRMPSSEEQSSKCILCFEDCTLTKAGQTLVYSAFVQRSKVLPGERKLHSSIHASSCGHVMHMSCWQGYYSNEETKEHRRPLRNRHLISPTLPSTEFLCPYCRCLSNTVLPLTAQLYKYAQPNIFKPSDDVFPLDQWLEVLKTFGDELIKATDQKNHAADNDFDDEADSILTPVFQYPAWETILKNSYVIVDVEQFEKIAEPIGRPELPENWNKVVEHYMKLLRQHAPNEAEDNEKENVLWLWRSCVYTLQSLEMFLRAINRPLKDHMSIRHESCLNGLVRASCMYAAVLTQTDVDNLLGPVTDLLEMMFKQKYGSVLEWDCFAMMVKTIFMVPNMMLAASPLKSIVPNGSMIDFYTLQLYFLANVVKAVVLFKDASMDIDEDFECPDVKNLSPKIQENIAVFYRKYNIYARQHQGKPKQSSEENPLVESMEDTPSSDPCPGNIECNQRTITMLLDHIKAEMREFLRCSCLFFRYVTNVDFPDEFKTSAGDTFVNMCNYLGLQSNLGVYFDTESAYATILETFADHPHIANATYEADGKKLRRMLYHKSEDCELPVVPCVLPVPKLIDLPDDYSELINSVSDVICPNNEREEMKMPTMCLTCGKLLCAHSYCCQPELNSRPVGACTYHAHECGGEIGIFLRIRDCQVVCLGRYKGCFMQPPYLDKYGESDQGLRRGNPLSMCRARYDKIHLTWLGHGLHEEIARLNDNSAVQAAQWHHM